MFATRESVFRQFELPALFFLVINIFLEVVMDLISMLILIGAIIVILGLIGFALSKQYYKVGPNEVLIVSGGRKRTVTEVDGTTRIVGYRMHIGGGTFVKPFIERAEKLSLETYSMTIKTPEVLTRQGVHIISQATSQVKVAPTDIAIRKAAEQFLGRGSKAIIEATEHILEGYMRSTIGALTVEEIYQDRNSFGNRVRKFAEDDLTKMGLELISFNLGDISDTQGYIDALGKPRIAMVKRDASVAQAEAERDTVIRTAQARKEGDIVGYQVETETAQANRDFELKRSGFQIELNKRKAESDLAYEIERNKLSIDLKEVEWRAKLIEKEALIKVEQQEILRKELELQATVLKPAESRKLQIQTEADAEKYRLTTEAEGKAKALIEEGKAGVEVKRAEGISRIEYTRKIGIAEAEAMQARAESFKEYNDAAVYQMTMEKLPELARAVSEPLSKIDKIVMVGDGASGVSKLTGVVNDIISQIPETVKAITGKDIFGSIGKKGDSSKDKSSMIE